MEDLINIDKQSKRKRRIKFHRNGLLLLRYYTHIYIEVKLIIHTWIDEKYIYKWRDKGERTYSHTRSFTIMTLSLVQMW